MTIRAKRCVGEARERPVRIAGRVAERRKLNGLAKLRTARVRTESRLWRLEYRAGSSSSETYL